MKEMVLAMSDTSYKTFKKVLGIISILMLLGTLADNPYSYYVLLRWVVCIAAISIALSFKALNKEGWFITLLITAFLFNPLIPVHLNKQLWTVLDLVTAAIFLVSIFKLENNTKRFPANE
ncbi:MAG: hypothetical protein IPK79_12990 [Vampirovibrionales bacterium]|nr:hypothetical protein [Vampirovibrionales bacterium]